MNSYGKTIAMIKTIQSKKKKKMTKGTMQGKNFMKIVPRKGHLFTHIKFVFCLAVF